MSVVLHVPLTRWRAHQRRIAQETPGLVPVAKGNGYGFGLPLLAGQATDLGVDTLAVGTADEVAEVRPRFAGDVVVLQPWRAGEDLAVEPRVIRTVSRVEDLRILADAGYDGPILLELLTSMRRHGMRVDDLLEVRQLLRNAPLVPVGWTIHLPMPAASAGNGLEAERLAKAGLAVQQLPVWLSHITTADHDRLRATLFTETRVRVGTELWLGGSYGRRTTATVLDVHPVSRGDRVGYWQRRVASDGHVIVLSGGTAHGVALSAPTAAASTRQRLQSAVTGSAEALGFALSPFTIGGKKRWFIEPPHMQSSMVFLPGKRPPAVGTEVPVELRLTTAHVDEVLFDES